jgi:hypothetical protein
MTIRISVRTSDDEDDAASIFTIVIPVGLPLITRDRQAAQEHLQALGIKEAQRYLDQACRGGVLEIIPPGGEEQGPWSLQCTLH